MTIARLGGWLGLVLVAVLAGTGTGPAPVTAGGATIVVDTLADPAGSEECGLRAAIVNILTVSRSTISENNADGDGGGLYSTGTANIDNSTISGNVSSGQGGGAFVVGGLAGGPTTLINVTVTNNAGDNAVFNNFGSATLANTIIADQASGADCGGWEFTSLGFNLDSDVTCDLGAAGDRPGADANLAPLADNGGPTMTHRLLEGSAAINAGNNGVCEMGPIAGVDQRGVPRPQGAVCDIGAFELGAERIWGDLDCDGNVAIGDALKTARYLLGLSVSQEDGCPEPGAEALVNATPRAWGDVDCDASVAIGDALKIARWLLGLGVSQEDGCPEIGSQVEVAG